MDTAQREDVILEQLGWHGRVETDDLARLTGSATITIRRDLERLASGGRLRRIHGGAVTVTLRGEGTGFAQRQLQDQALKRRLAVAAAGLIGDGEAVAVDSGTTGAAVAAALAGRRVTTVPLSVQTLSALVQGGTTILAPGGEVDDAEGTFFGPLTERSLADLRLDTTLLTCCAAGVADGVMAYSVRDAAVKRAARDRSARTVLVAEASKFSRSALAVVCDLADLTVLVTDTSLLDDVRTFCANHDVEVVLVEHVEGETV